jgi:hypothetical protein
MTQTNQQATTDNTELHLQKAGARTLFETVKAAAIASGQPHAIYLFTTNGMYTVEPVSMAKHITAHGVEEVVLRAHAAAPAKPFEIIDYAGGEFERLIAAGEWSREGNAFEVAWDGLQYHFEPRQHANAATA